MNNNEAASAYKFFEDFFKMLDSYGETKIPSNPYCKASRCAMKALEKQIEKKPQIEEWDKRGPIFTCPVCGSYLGTVHFKGMYNYCPDCGQRIIWEEA